MVEKKNESVSVKLSDNVKRFVDARFKQRGMESASEYIRHLIDVDHEKASSDLNLLADALGVQVINENEVSR